MLLSTCQAQLVPAPMADRILPADLPGAPPPRPTPDSPLPGDSGSNPGPRPAATGSSHLIATETPPPIGSLKRSHSLAEFRPPPRSYWCFAGTETLLLVSGFAVLLNYDWLGSPDAHQRQRLAGLAWAETRKWQTSTRERIHPRGCDNSCPPGRWVQVTLRP